MNVNRPPVEGFHEKIPFVLLMRKQFFFSQRIDSRVTETSLNFSLCEAQMATN